MKVAVDFSPRTQPAMTLVAERRLIHPAFKRRSATHIPFPLHHGLKPTAIFVRSLRDPSAAKRNVWSIENSEEPEIHPTGTFIRRACCFPPASPCAGAIGAPSTPG